MITIILGTLVRASQINTELGGGGLWQNIDQRIYNSETGDQRRDQRRERSQTGQDGEREEPVVCCQTERGSAAQTPFTVAEISVIAVADGSVTAGLSHVRPPGGAGDRSLEPLRGLHLS